MLTPVESFWLRWHAEHSPSPFNQRARIARLAGSDAPPAAIASALGIPETEAARVVADFARHRLSDFPRPSLSLDAILEAAHVDIGHARHVAALAVMLFDHTAALHRLPVKLRGLLETGALLHNVGVEVDEPRHHTAGRDLLACMHLEGYDAQAQHLLACLVSFHRKRVIPENESQFTALTPARRRHALALAALLRIADGLDYSQSQSTQLHGVVLAPDAMTLRLSGPEAKGDAARARKKADLWREVFHLELGTQTTPEPAPDPRQLADLSLEAGTPMSEVARRATALHYLRWKKEEHSAMDGDVAAMQTVHAAMQGVRAVLDLFAGYFKRKPIRRLKKRLRATEALLGDVRDTASLLASVQAYQVDQSRMGRVAELQPLISSWKKAHAQHRKNAAAWFSSPAAADLHTALTDFVTHPPITVDEPLGEGMRKVLAAASTKVAKRQAALAPEKLKSYHRLRLAVERLRFGLESFSPALGPEAQTLATDLAHLLDRLSSVDEARFLQKQIAVFLDVWAEQQAKRKAPQLHGAHGILEFAQAHKAGGAERVKRVTQACAPVRATRLRQRLKNLLNTARA